MPFTDHYGFHLATDNQAAATAYDLGARSFVAWRADAMAHLDAAIELESALDEALHRLHRRRIAAANQLN